MKVQQLLEHHGVSRNPFAEEDAQTDPVFKDHCIESTYHPTWDKIYGDPGEPSTSIVFGEKGAGKTAMRLQIAQHLEEHNKNNPDKRSFIVHYDDFNPFIDRFINRIPARLRRKPDKALSSWQLWDHMDAILSLATTKLVDSLMLKKSDPNSIPRTVVNNLDSHQKRDLMLLAGLYDQSTRQPVDVLIGHRGPPTTSNRVFGANPNC